MAGGIAAGAAVGTQIMPGWGTAIGAVAGGLLDAFGGGGQSAASAKPEGPASAAIGVYGSGLDGSNWNVNFGGSQTNTSEANKPFTASGPTASTAAGGGILPAASGGGGAPLDSLVGGTSVPSWALYLAAGLGLWKLVS